MLKENKNKYFIIYMKRSQHHYDTSNYINKIYYFYHSVKNVLIKHPGIQIFKPLFFGTTFTKCPPPTGCPHIPAYKSILLVVVVVRGCLTVPPHPAQRISPLVLVHNNII